MPLSPQDASPTLIALHGQPGDAGRSFRIAVVAEGFPAKQLGPFMAAARRLKELLSKVRPFASHMDRILLTAVPCTSKASTKDLSDSNRGPIDGLTPCAAYWAAPGLPVGDTTAVWKLLRYAVAADPEYAGRGFDIALVIVNHGNAGGRADGSVCYAWRDSPAKIFLHELGHTFGLADEYDHPAGEPATISSHTGASGVYANVTTEVVKERIPWRHLLAAGIPIPSTYHETVMVDCKRPDGIWPAAQATDVVGLFQGALQSVCGAYRPSAVCRMDDHNDPFCPVCTQIIKMRLLGGLFLAQQVVRTATPSRPWTHMLDSEILKDWDVNARSVVAYDATDGEASILELTLDFHGLPAHHGELKVLTPFSRQRIGSGWSTLTRFDIGNLKLLLCTSFATGERAIFEVRRNENVMFVERWRDAALDTGYTHVVAFLMAGATHFFSYSMFTGEVKLEAIEPLSTTPAPATLVSTRTGGEAWRPGFRCLTAVGVGANVYLVGIADELHPSGEVHQAFTLALPHPPLGNPALGIPPRCVTDERGSPHSFYVSPVTHAAGMTLGGKPYVAAYSALNGYVTLWAVRPGATALDFCDQRFIGLGGQMWLGTGAPALGTGGSFNQYLWLYRGIPGQPGEFREVEFSHSKSF